MSSNARTPRRPGRAGTSTAVGPDPADSPDPGDGEDGGPDTTTADATAVTVLTGPAAMPPRDTVPPPEKPTAARTAADIAAARRAAIDPTPAQPGIGGPPVPGAVPGTVIASATTRAEFAGDGSPGRPVGGVWQGRPLVMQIQPGAAAGQTAHMSDYVIAECDATESTVMPRMKTPVTKKVWSVGQLVYRPFYEAVLAEHARRVAEGSDAEPVPAELPEGRTALPADAVAGSVAAVTSPEGGGLPVDGDDPGEVSVPGPPDGADTPDETSAPPPPAVSPAAPAPPVTG